MTTFNDQVFHMGGVPVGGLLTQGKVIHVKPYSGNNSYDGLSPETAVKTLAQALSLATADQNDIVLLYSESNTASLTTDYQSTALNWNKDGVHLIGVGSTSMLGQRARISNLSTATAIVDGLFIVSADNCRIENVEVFHGQGGTNPTGASIAVSVTGQRNHFVNCQISGIGHTELDDATSRSLKISGSENLFSHCYIGLDTVIRGTAQAEVEIADSTARTIFEDCIFNTYTSADGFLMVKYAAADRFILLDNCKLIAIQNITSATQPAAALSASTTLNGNVIFHNSMCYGFDNVTAADDTKVLLGTFATAGVDAGLAAGVDVA